jgi:serine/threonine protein kinase
VSALPDRIVGRLAESLAVPTLPDRYELVEVIGRGGMGAVWRARDRLLEREVAVKVLAEHVRQPEVAARLAREALILAKLEHPGIVAVHDTGTLADGRTWYAMRLVRGDRLDHAARRFGSQGEMLRALMRVAETVAFAHARGVLHRDLTPRNVMLGPFGEVLVLDWGVAREGAEDREAVGTPGYVAPEQAAGRPDVRSDVFGLGAILRDLLAERSEPIPKRLAAIRDRALAPDPDERYPDAAAFRDDLGRFLDGAPVSAYREGLLEAAGRLAWQHRTALGLVAAYLLMRVAFLWWRGF